MSPKIVLIDEKLEQIREGALSVFAEKGYYSSKMEDIARDAGMGKGTLYHYFKSKEEVFDFMVERFFSEYEGMFQTLEKMGLDEAVDFMVEAAFSLTEKEKRIIQLLLQVWGHAALEKQTKTKVLIQQVYAKYIEQFSGFIARVKKGEKNDYKALSRQIFAMLDGMMIQIFLYPETAGEKEEMKKAILKMIR
ncbi:MAG TPA: hypothetical protein DHW82_03525 [Spirochaetia bacterium]|nr:MAG: hypothetical protein A2Y41_06385 [Spirochaetes bacterium GWB1_36_13]HCL56063.1 hypothetical protein [Spirochaetia bacterium]